MVYRCDVASRGLASICELGFMYTRNGCVNESAKTHIGPQIAVLGTGGQMNARLNVQLTSMGCIKVYVCNKSVAYIKTMHPIHGAK